VEEIESNEQKLDLEWIQLIKEAKNLGIEKEEIREFLSSHREKEKLQ
jgi:antagonist of SinR